MFRKFNTIVASLVALVASTVAFGQVQFIDVDPSGSVILNGNYYDSATNTLLIAGWSPSEANSWLYRVNMGNGTWTRDQIPAAINGGRVTATGISRDGQNIFGWMDSSGSDPLYAGEGFFAPVGNVSNRTLIGFLSGGAAESRVHSMSANGIAVGDSAGATSAITWSSSGGIEALPFPGNGGSSATTITSNGNHIGGFFADSGFGSEGAGTWNLNGNQWQENPLSPLDGLSSVISGSSDGVYLGGTRNFNATAWINGSFQEILLNGFALSGAVKAVTDDGFFVGIGDFNGTSLGFVWHEGWSEAMTARDYVLWSQGIDIGHDILELNGAFSYGGNLYLTGYGSGAVLQTPAVVPEPCALELLGTGVATLFGRRRRA